MTARPSPQPMTARELEMARNRMRLRWIDLARLTGYSYRHIKRWRDSEWPIPDAVAMQIRLWLASEDARRRLGIAHPLPRPTMSLTDWRAQTFAED